MALVTTACGDARPTMVSPPCSPYRCLFFRAGAHLVFGASSGRVAFGFAEAEVVGGSKAVDLSIDVALPRVLIL